MKFLFPLILGAATLFGTALTPTAAQAGPFVYRGHHDRWSHNYSYYGGGYYAPTYGYGYYSPGYSSSYYYAPATTYYYPTYAVPATSYYYPSYGSYYPSYGTYYGTGYGGYYHHPHLPGHHLLPRH